MKELDEDCLGKINLHIQEHGIKCPCGDGELIPVFSGTVPYKMTYGTLYDSHIVLVPCMKCGRVTTLWGKAIKDLFPPPTE